VTQAGRTTPAAQRIPVVPMDPAGQAILVNLVDLAAQVVQAGETDRYQRASFANFGSPCQTLEVKPFVPAE